MDYMTAKEAAEKWAITPRRVQVLCAQGKILGAVRFGITWAIPKDAQKLKDGRRKAQLSYLLMLLVHCKAIFSGLIFGTYYSTYAQL